MLYTFLTTVTAPGVAEEKSPIMSILTILLAIILGVIALKILKSFGKTIFIGALIITVVLLVTGIIDFAMIKSAGYGLLDKIFHTDLYQKIAEVPHNIFHK